MIVLTMTEHLTGFGLPPDSCIHGDSVINSPHIKPELIKPENIIDCSGNIPCHGGYFDGDIPHDDYEMYFECPRYAYCDHAEERMRQFDEGKIERKYSRPHSAFHGLVKRNRDRDLYIQKMTREQIHEQKRKAQFHF